MIDMHFWPVFGKLAAAAVLGGLIGLERETHGRPAGLRTHILVCMGAALYALTSYAISRGHYDPGRVTAQIVTGIGFLGAGTIMRQGSAVRGLTTAASIWTVAAIGIAVAVGGTMFYIAIAATAIVVATLFLVPYVEGYALLRREERLLTFTVKAEPAAMSDIITILTRYGIEPRVMGIDESREAGIQIVRLRVRIRRDFDQNKLANDLIASEAIISYSWD